MDVFTTQISNWRTAVSLGIWVIDTTYKGNYSIFAPVGQMVWDYKDGRMDECDYARAYNHLMNQSVQHNQVRWDEFLLQFHDQRVAMGCFCPPGQFCHRHLLIPMLAKYAHWRNVPFVYYGELLPNAKP